MCMCVEMDLQGLTRNGNGCYENEELRCGDVKGRVVHAVLYCCLVYCNTCTQQSLQ